MKLFSLLVDNRSRGLVPLLLAVCLNGCSSLGYYGQLLGGQLDLLERREPIAELVTDPHGDPRLRQRLGLVLQARAFASRTLDLPDNGSYRQYADLGRPYVMWNVFATGEFSVQPRTQCFPIAGCVAYRGYYALGRARGAAALLQQQGLDTWIGGVEAYSTLGWFDDPILGGMLRHSDDELAALIFHELAHQKLYVRDDSAFNESFATFVERQGLRQWRASRGLPAPNESGERREEQFVALMLQTRERLARLYAGGLPAAEMRRAKQAEFERLRGEYRRLRDGRWGGDRRYDAWVFGPLNNAKLLPFGLYHGWVGAFEEIFRSTGENWPRFYVEVQRLAHLPAAERHRRLDGLQARAPKEKPPCTDASSSSPSAS